MRLGLKVLVKMADWSLSECDCDTGVLVSSTRFHGGFKAIRINPEREISLQAVLSRSNVITLKLNKALCEFDEEKKKGKFASAVDPSFRLGSSKYGRRNVRFRPWTEAKYSPEDIGFRFDGFV